MKFKHENLEVWQLSLVLVKKIYQLTNFFPKEEIYGLTNQIRRAVVSITLNIAEGSGRATKKDFSRFIRNAIGSLLEVDTAFKLAVELKYITADRYDKEISNTIEELYFKLIKLDKVLRNGR